MKNYLCLSLKSACFIAGFVLFFSFFQAAIAEDLPAGVIPKLPRTADDPVLSGGTVYPFWGPVCQRYTYSVTYSDAAGRDPEYMRMYFNGSMVDMEKADAAASDYKKGVTYIYKNVPNKFGSNFYYFEASNGIGKTRDSIIDSPDNGPMLFDADFKDNEIVLIDPAAGREVWRYATGEEWVGAVALSGDGTYLAAQTSNHIYLFNTRENKPVWDYKSRASNLIGGDVKGGVAISADGSAVFAALNGEALFFGNSSNKPAWTYNLNQNGGGAYGVDIDPSGRYAAVAMAGSESDEQSNVLLLFTAAGKKLWQYHAAGNWHEVRFSGDGSYLAAATGCPDRRGYLFSAESAEPIVRSEPLSKESPVDEADISSDGALAAYGVESGYGAVVLVSRDTGKVVWKYETPQGWSVRALSMTPDGGTIGAGTFGGDILLFGKDSSRPIGRATINSAIGAFDVSDDGSFFATGSADKKVRIFTASGSKKAEITLSEYVGEIDISANNRYVAAGTSGSVYFFESLIDLNHIPATTCSEIIEPPARSAALSGMFDRQSIFAGVGSSAGNSTAIIFLSAAFLVIGAGLLIAGRKFHLSYQKIIAAVSVLFIICLALVFYIWNRGLADEGQNAFEPSGAGTAESGVCGNTVCEPDFGETRDNCPQDCSGGAL